MSFRVPPYKLFENELLVELQRHAVLSPETLTRLSQEGEAGGYFLLFKVTHENGPPTYRPFDYIRRPNYWNALLGPGGAIWKDKDTALAEFKGLLGADEKGEDAGSDKWAEVWGKEQTRNTKVSFYLLTDKKPIRSGNASVQAFNYVSKSTIDLKSAQIYQAHELATNRKQRLTHCLVHALTEAKVEESMINSIVYNCIQNGARHLNTTDLKKVTTYMKRKIHLSRINLNLTSGTAGFRIKEVTIGKSDEAGEPINLAIFENHIFHNPKVNTNLDLLKASVDSKYVMPTRKRTVSVKPLLWVVKQLQDLGAFELITPAQHNEGRDEKLDDYSKADWVEQSEIKLSQESIDSDQRICDFKEYKGRNEMYFAADCESFTGNGSDPHELALLGIAKVSDPNDWKNLDVKSWSFNENPVLNMLNYVYQEVTGERLPHANASEVEEEDMFTDHEAAINNHSIPAKKKRKRGIDTEAVIFFHNLRYDRSVLQEHLRIYDILESDGHLYYMKVHYFGLQIVFRDSLKHLDMSLATMCKSLDLPQDLRKKECGINYDYFSKQNHGTRCTVDDYIQSSNGKLSRTDMKEALQDGVGDWDPFTDSFSPWELYKYYLYFDVACLSTGLHVYQNSGKELSISYLKNIELDPLAFTTKSSFSKCLAQQGGVFDNSAEYSGALRKFIMQSIRGGRVTCHPEFEGKTIIPSEAGIIYMDAVSEYPSAMVQMCDDYGGFPTGKAELMISKDCIDDINTFYYIAQIRITEIRKKVIFSYPIIAYKAPNSDTVAYIQDLPNGQPFTVTIGKIDLEEYIRFHDIQYEFIQGLKWTRQTTPNPEWGDMIKHLFNQRKVYKDAKNTPMSNNIKTCMNSQYGSSITKIRESKTTILCKDRADLQQALINIFHSVIEFYDLGQVLQLKRSSVDMSYMSCLFGSIVLCMSRRINNRLLWTLEECGVYALYGDTDSCMFDSKHLDLVRRVYKVIWNKELEGTELGQFHSDFENIPGCVDSDAIRSSKLYLVGKKIYCHETYGQSSDGKVLVGRQYKCKGIPKKALDYEAQIRRCPGGLHAGISSIYADLVPEGGDYDENNEIIDRSVNFLCNPYGSVRFVYAKNRTVTTPSEPFFRKVSRAPMKNSGIVYLR